MITQPQNLIEKIFEEIDTMWNASGLNDTEEFCNCPAFSPNECKCKSRKEKFKDTLKTSLLTILEGLEGEEKTEDNSENFYAFWEENNGFNEATRTHNEKIKSLIKEIENI